MVQEYEAMPGVSFDEDALAQALDVVRVNAGVLPAEVATS